MSLDAARQPAGVPVGGQFATTTRTEPEVALTGPPHWVMIEREHGGPLAVGPFDTQEAANEAMEDSVQVEGLCQEDCLDAYVGSGGLASDVEEVSIAVDLTDGNGTPFVLYEEIHKPSLDALKAQWREAFDALQAAGLESDADDPIAKRYRDASDTVNHALRKTDFEVMTGNRPTPAAPAGPRVMMTVQLQEWVSDTAYPVGDEFQVDVTDLVARMTPEQVAALKDDDDTADDLFLRSIDEGATEHHNGPFSVQVQASVRSYTEAVETQKLTALAGELKVDPTDLDDAVRDVTDSMASTMVNLDVDDVTIEDSQDRHYQSMDEHASSVNNGGLPTQVEFLVDQLGPERTEAILRESAAATARSAALVRPRKPGR